jgi:bis(5'-nucleosyl)-tetraphosphatase (symmetrical)
MDYLVGDVQGCCDAFERLLAEIGFSPSRDHLVLVGDLVNRGPDSLGTLKRLRDLGDAVTCLLGNHDLHLLAVAHGVRKARKDDTLHDILGSKERDSWLDWLRQRRMAHRFNGWLLVHAGVVPQWDTPTTLALAGEIEALLRGPELPQMLQGMYGNEPALWSETLQGPPRWRFIINALTRMRFCTPEGRLELQLKEGAHAAPPGYRPWFDIAGRRTRGTPIAFGHWSTLGLINRPDLLALDTGCVWGGALTAVRVDGGRREIVQVRCEQAQRPG